MGASWEPCLKAFRDNILYWSLPPGMLMFDFVNKNKEWIFSGIGITILGLLFLWGKRALRHFAPAQSDGPIVKVSAGMASTWMGGLVDVIIITVQNPTNRFLYLGNIFLELNTGQLFMPLKDPVTGRGQEDQQLEPGNKVSFHILVADIINSGYPPSAFKCAAVRDALEQVHRSTEKELWAVFEPFCRSNRNAG
jgi:hypothetical protein